MWISPPERGVIRPPSSNYLLHSNLLRTEKQKNLQTHCSVLTNGHCVHNLILHKLTPLEHAGALDVFPTPQRTITPFHHQTPLFLRRIFFSLESILYGAASLLRLLLFFPNRANTQSTTKGCTLLFTGAVLMPVLLLDAVALPTTYQVAGFGWWCWSFDCCLLTGSVDFYLEYRPIWPQAICFPFLAVSAVVRKIQVFHAIRSIFHSLFHRKRESVLSPLAHSLTHCFSVECSSL